MLLYIIDRMSLVPPKVSRLSQGSRRNVTTHYNTQQYLYYIHLPTIGTKVLYK